MDRGRKPLRLSRDRRRREDASETYEDECLADLGTSQTLKDPNPHSLRNFMVVLHSQRDSFVETQICLTLIRKPVLRNGFASLLHRMRYDGGYQLGSVDGF